MFLGPFVPFRWICPLKKEYRDKIQMPRRQLFMTKTYDVIMNCFISAAFFVQFPLFGYWFSSMLY